MYRLAPERRHEDYDPSRSAVAHDTGGFAQHAPLAREGWLDSGAELPAGAPCGPA